MKVSEVRKSRNDVSSYDCPVIKKRLLLSTWTLIRRIQGCVCKRRVS